MKLPATLPRVSQLLDRENSIEAMAAYLDLSAKTIKSYRDTDTAPMAAHWAMYWISPWGQQWLQCEFRLGNELLHAQLRTLKGQVGALRAYVEHIEHASDGAANAPAFDPAAWRGIKGISCSRPTGFEQANRLSLQRQGGSILVNSSVARGAEK
jgi:hypothetical protein